MAYREIVPHPALRPFVDRLWVSEGGEGAGEPRRILPDGCVDLLLDAEDGGEARVVGTMTRPLLLSPGPSSPIVAVRFRPGGASPFLRVRADELTDESVDGGQLSMRWLSAEQVLGSGAGLAEQARGLEQALLARLSSVAVPDPCLVHAVSALIGPEAPSVDELARRIGWSRQHLGRVVRAQVGLGPKELGRVARVQRAIAELQRGARGAEVAAGQGYFDEAHMARDFRELVGLTPGQARAAVGSIFPIRSLFAGA